MTKHGIYCYMVCHLYMIPVGYIVGYIQYIVAEQSLPSVISNILTTTNNPTAFTFLVLNMTFYELRFCTIRD